MSLKGNYSVEIVARGQGIVYSEEGRQLNFGIVWSREEHGWVFDAYECSDKEFRPVKPSPEDRSRVVARIVEFLEAKGDRVRVVSERPAQPLRTVAEIAEERLRRPGG